jgi:hypothetical protein
MYDLNHVPRLTSISVFLVLLTKGSLPRLVPSVMTYDPFSASIRRISHNLTTLNVRARIDYTLFWPSRHESNVTTPE